MKYYPTSLCLERASALQQCFKWKVIIVWLNSKLQYDLRRYLRFQSCTYSGRSTDLSNIAPLAYIIIPIGNRGSLSCDTTGPCEYFYGVRRTLVPFKANLTNCQMKGIIASPVVVWLYGWPSVPPLFSPFCLVLLFGIRVSPSLLSWQHLFSPKY